MIVQPAETMSRGVRCGLVVNPAVLLSAHKRLGLAPNEEHREHPERRHAPQPINEPPHERIVVRPDGRRKRSGKVVSPTGRRAPGLIGQPAPRGPIATVATGVIETAEALPQPMLALANTAA